MAFQVSPGVKTSEVDLTAGVQTISTSAAAFAGPFAWGPALESTSIGSESSLVQIFGKPDSEQFEYWFSAASFLAYSNQLRVVRAIAATAVNATANNVAGALIKNSDHYDVLAEGTSVVANATFELAAAKYPGELGNSLKISLCPSALAFQDDTITGTLALTADSTAVTGSGTDFTADLVVGDYISANSNWYQVSAVGTATALTLSTASKDTISTVASGTWSRKWEYHDTFGEDAPGTSGWATDRSGVTDELHLVVVDEDGLFTGVKGQVVEKYAYLSKASDAKTLNGETNYYKTVLNRNSAYVWWLNHVGTTTNWGTGATSTTFGSKVLPYSTSFVGGNSNNDDITTGNIQTGWDEFADKDGIDVSLLITGPSIADNQVATLASYVIANIAEVRKDCVAFISPAKNSVVSNGTAQAADVLLDRAAVSSTSYAFMDSGWKYTYDRYNDVYRWVPLNGDIAGLAARSDTTNDPWYSPAGYSRGNIKNVVKLGWNPKQVERDDLYSKGVNPVVSFPGQGVLLFGDKTLLSRPSAFDRINVRRLFIVLEKTIERYAKSQLFEYNDEYTRSAFRNVVEPFLRDVKGRRGLTDYLVVCDSSNNPASIVDQNQFVGDIYVKPARSINFIQLNFVAVRSGVSFQEVVGAV
jgi:hypothetical protein